MRKNNKGWAIVWVAAMIGVCVLQGVIAPTSAQAQTKQLSMGTATVGGIFYNVGSPLAQCVNKALPEVNITAEFTEGSTENLRLIDQKKMELAIITPQIGYNARMGLAMFKNKKIEFYSLARLLPNANVWVVLESSKVKSIAEGVVAFPTEAGKEYQVVPNAASN